VQDLPNHTARRHESGDASARAEVWKHVKHIAGEAWALPPAERTAFVTAACADDVSLRREVLSLVAAMEAAEGRFETPAWSPAAGADLSSLAGRRIGPYEILARIGAGGMGEVYKARDSRLNRVVALKVLPGPAAMDSAARERMSREARAVAALNHPHICTLYDIGEHDGLHFLVMEYVEGETLAACLTRGALPVDLALEYAEQIALALREAHRAGIVHRDVKPGNIMLAAGSGGPDGARCAKLLDFGIAKSTADPAPGTRHSVLAETGLDLTVPGFVPGTAPYMAPEQIEGLATDARSDVFAFGAVLFEMVTGRKAFTGATRADVVGAILSGDRPRVSRHLPAATPALDRFVMTCLARNPADRQQSFDEVLTGLRALRPRLDARKRITWALVAAIAVVVGGGLAWVGWAGRDAARAPVVTRLPATAGIIGAAALSPDGSTLVFSWMGEGVHNPELVLLPIGATSRQRLTHNPGIEEWPAWSPDGSQVAFVRCEAGGCAIRILAVAGGAERKLADLRNDRYHCVAWSPDGRWIAYAERASLAEPYALFLLALDGTPARRLTLPKTGFGELRFAFSPDSRTVAVIRVGPDIGLYLVAIETGNTTALLSGQREWFGGLSWTEDGRHLIVSAHQQGIRRLWKLPTTGGVLEQLAVAGQDAYYPSVAARGGRLAFVHELLDWDLASLNLLDGSASSFSSSPKPELYPAFSPDGQALAFVSERSGTREIWVSRADGTDARQLTFLNGPQASQPAWSPDSRWLAFQGSGIHVIPAGGGPPRKVFDDGEWPSWSADGQWIYFTRATSGRSMSWRVAATGGPGEPAITGEAFVVHDGPGDDLYFLKLDGGLRRHPGGGGPSTVVVPDFAAGRPATGGSSATESTTPAANLARTAPSPSASSSSTSPRAGHRASRSCQGCSTISSGGSRCRPIGGPWSTLSAPTIAGRSCWSKASADGGSNPIWPSSTFARLTSLARRSMT
jgi:Tol biopolymer transport system component